MCEGKGMNEATQRGTLHDMARKGAQERKGMQRGMTTTKGRSWGSLLWLENAWVNNSSTPKICIDVSEWDTNVEHSIFINDDFDLCP